MPQFILDTSEAGPPWESLSALAQGFVEAAFFCETSQFDKDDFDSPDVQEAIHEGQADGNIPKDAGVGDIAGDSFCAVKDFCDAFEETHAAALALAYERPDYDESAAGRDLYYTYAGHGVGFWSRDQLDAGDLGATLTDAAGSGEISLYWSDAGRVEFYIG